MFQIVCGRFTFRSPGLSYAVCIMKMHLRSTLCLLAFATFFCSSCSPRSEQQALTVKGSDTMVQLGQRWAEIYMNQNPGVVIQVTGGGSGTGIAALINGSTDIAQASRAMREQEKQAALEQRGAEVAEVAVALDALAVYLNTENPINSLSIDEISGIFRGEVTNWSEVGGDDAEIVLYGRENSSGTYVYFKEQVMDDADFGSLYQSLPGTAAVINAVTEDPAGVGYGGIGYAEGVKTISVSPNSGDSPIEPTMENVLSNAYPLSRNLYFYTIGQPEGLEGQFVDWALSAEGQDIVSEVGYYPLRPDEAQ
jgi:phosphate transport system substrate-binding protein